MFIHVDQFGSFGQGSIEAWTVRRPSTAIQSGFAEIVEI